MGTAVVILQVYQELAMPSEIWKTIQKVKYQLHSQLQLQSLD